MAALFSTLSKTSATTRGMDSDIAGALQRTFATFQHQSELKSYFLFSVTLLERFLEHKLHSVFIECKESEMEDFQHNTNVKTTANAHVVTPLCPGSIPIYILMNSVILRNNVLQSLQHRGHVFQSVVVAKTDPGTTSKLVSAKKTFFEEHFRGNDCLSEGIHRKRSFV